VTVPPVNETAAAAETPAKTEPGFEAIIAIAGLLAVAFLVLRQRK
jgi:PGF-CTERM protein